MKTEICEEDALVLALYSQIVNRIDKLSNIEDIPVFGRKSSAA